MPGKRRTSRISATITATSAALIVALIAAFAFVSDGYSAQRLDLGDSSVWVVNGDRQAIGRANTEILQLNTVVSAAAAELDVVQSGSTVLLVDRANAKVDIVDPAISEVVDSVALPTESPELYLVGDNVVIHAAGTGEVWLVAQSELAGFDAGSEAALSLGRNSALAVTAAGMLYAYSVEAARLYWVDATVQNVSNLIAAITSREVAFTGTDARVSISAVGNEVVLLDTRGRTLWAAGEFIDLSELIGIGQVAALQRPGPASEVVLVAWRSGLAEVPFNGSTPRQLVQNRSGVAAAPVEVDGCRFAAWADGTVWRDCAGSAVEILQVSRGPSLTGSLVFEVNGDRAVLNEPRSGATWAVQANGELIDNWAELIEVEQDQEEVQQNDADLPPEYEKAQLPPVATDDEFGARPGRATVLPVLLNDFDPNGDVLVISELGGVDGALGRLELVRDRQQVQLTLTDGATGSFSFPYTITDGRGGSASATVQVTVRAPSENSPPVQVRPTRTLVAEGGRVTANVFGDWVDPDGDAFYLTSAGTAAPDLVSYRPEGVVVFQEGGGATAVRSVSLVMSDGMAESSGSMAITVNPPGEVPIIADPFIVRSYAGSEVKVSPLDHVRGGTGTLRLSAVPSTAGANIIANLSAGRFRFTSDQVRTFYVEYVVTDGSQTATGLVRIDVEAPPDSNSTPITIPKTVFVKTLSSQTVDVASLDTDPAGGVLLVTGIDAIDPAVGVRADVLEQRSIRVSLVAPLEGRPATFSYRITNGLAEAVGLITVIEIPNPEFKQAPVATDDTATVRVGDTIDIAVLDNDLHPDGEELRLNPKLVETVRSSAGLLFVAGNRLRFLATEKTGDFTAVYEVAGPDGQTSQAQVRISVREVVEATNNPPTPATVVARVVAGETVSIRIPLTGIDPDGDSVQLLGQEGNPEKGAVTQIGADFIEYQAGGYSAGTDVFSYTVVDSLGARASGKVRVGISPPLAGARNPVAIADEVVTRPGGSVSVRVLENDSDPDGSALTITSVEAAGTDVTAEIDGELVIVTLPSAEGSYGLVYSIENEFGGTSAAFITVTVDSEAPLAYPVAGDTVLALPDILDRTRVSVEVLQNVFFADGPVSTLKVKLLDGYRSSATVKGSRVEVTVLERRQTVPFAVVHPDDPDVVSYAFIRVPGFEDALPQRDRRARPLVVASESKLEIDINNHVIAVGGKKVRLTDTTTVQATHASSANLVVDSDTLVYISADKYFGPASISFEVTDGSTVDEVGARTATIVLPITVTPRENQPPVFLGGAIEFEPAEEKVLDLLKLTTYPYPDDLDELVFRVLEPLPQGFSYTLSGSTLKLRAAPDSAPGGKTRLTIGVRDAISEGKAGTVALGVVSSSRPLARPAPDTAVTPRGRSTVVDVLANDMATNPFPDQPLRVVAIRGLEGGVLPAGVSVVPSADRSKLTVSVSAEARAADVQLQYQVADATGDIARYVWGAVTISVQDVPDAPIAPVRAGGHVDGSVTLRITPPAFNNAPITNYAVVSATGDYRKDCGLQQLCTLSDLTVGAIYEFRVIATNAIGASAAGASSTPLRVDYLPGAPTNVSAVPSAFPSPEGTIAIRWSAVPAPSPGTSVSGYTVQVSGPGVEQVNITVGSGTSLVTTIDGRIQPGQSYQVTVLARNAAQATMEEWNRSVPVSVTAVGRPLLVNALSHAIVPDSGAIEVRWDDSSWNGTATGTYQLARFRESAPDVPTSCEPGATSRGAIAGAQSSPYTDAAVQEGNRYVYVVYSDNGFFCTVTRSGAVESTKAPGRASAKLTVVQRDDVTENFSTGYFDLQLTELGVSSGTAERYEYMLGGDGVWRKAAEEFPFDTFVTSAADSSVYGAPVSVQVRGCRNASAVFCGAESAVSTATPVATRASIPSCIPGEPFEVLRPANRAAGVTETYKVAYQSAGFVWTDFHQWSEGSVAPQTSIAIRVKATVTAGATTKEDPEYGETTCAQREATE